MMNTIQLIEVYIIVLNLSTLHKKFNVWIIHPPKLKWQSVCGKEGKKKERRRKEEGKEEEKKKEGRVLGIHTP